MRSPWRDALDGKIRIMHDILTESAQAQIEEYFKHSASLKRLVGEQRFENAAVQMAVAYADDMHKAIRLAEPFWVWEAIIDRISMHLAEEIHTNVVFEQSNPGLIAPWLTFRKEDLPVQEGLIWFQRPVKLSLEEQGYDSAWVRAIFFGLAGGASVNTRKGGYIELDTDDFDQLGVVAFVDSDASGLMNTKTGRTFFLPWICIAIAHEQTALQYAAAVKRNTPDITRTDFLLSTWPVFFCLEFFRLLRQNVLVPGGSGLEREARKEAKRHGLEPTIRVVQWRKAEYQYPEHHIVTPGNWQWQWRVRPHVRHLKSGKTVVVRGHIKGPQDRPLKPQDTRVHVVKR